MFFRIMKDMLAVGLCFPYRGKCSKYGLACWLVRFDRGGRYGALDPSHALAVLIEVLVFVFAKIGDVTAPALGFARFAHITPVQDQPVVGILLEVLGNRLE